MYLRQSNKWKEYVLQEGVEDIGLPPEVAHYLRQQNEEHGPVENKHLTWIGNLLKAFKSRNIYNAGTHQTIVDDIIGRGGWPDTPEGEEAWANAVGFVNDWYVDHSGHRGLPTLADLKALKKRGRKMLKKREATDIMLRQWDSYLDNRVMRAANSLKAYFVPIMQLLAEDPASYDELREEIVAAREEPHRGLRIASSIARDTLDNPVKQEEQVIHTFDNGYFWYDIQSHACDFEAKKMGHCGRGERGQLYSLRSGEKRREIKPMVTLEMDEDRTVYQIKGKANEAPKKDLWPYIDWFIENADVERITEEGMHSSDGLGFAEMLAYLEEKHPNVKFKDSWVAEATELLEQFAPTIESDSQTFQEVDWPSLDSPEVGFVLRHQAFWPVKDVIVDEDTQRLRWEVRQDAQSIADDTLYPNPRIRTVDVFARGVQDSEAAMLRVEMVWSDSFEPRDDGDERSVKEEIERLLEFLDEMQHLSKWLISPKAAPEEAEFDYNGFWERIQKRLEEYGVYRDVAGEIDAKDARDKSDQMDLPLQEARIIQRWSKIIK
jgi:hypothetical protein